MKIFFSFLLLCNIAYAGSSKDFFDNFLMNFSERNFKADKLSIQHNNPLDYQTLYWLLSSSNYRVTFLQDSKLYDSSSKKLFFNPKSSAHDIRFNVYQKMMKNGSNVEEIIIAIKRKNGSRQFMQILGYRDEVCVHFLNQKTIDLLPDAKITAVLEEDDNENYKTIFKPVVDTFMNIFK